MKTEIEEIIRNEIKTITKNLEESRLPGFYRTYLQNRLGTLKWVLSKIKK